MIKNSFSIVCPKEKNSNIFYNILFNYSPEKKNITIKINEINEGDSRPKINSIYSVCLSLEEWNKLAPDKSEFKDMEDIFKELNKISKKNCSLKFHDNSLDLVLKLDIYSFEPMNIPLKQGNEENDSIPYKIIEDNLNLKEENKRLEERIKNLEKEVELLKSALPNYLDKRLFHNLKSSKIIKEIEQLELINRGIYNLLQKNIKNIILKYEFKKNDMNNSLSFFNTDYHNLTNVLLVFKTKELRSLGSFYQKKDFGNKATTTAAAMSVPDYQMDYGAAGCNIFGQGSSYYINLNPKQFSNFFFFSLDKLKIYNPDNSIDNIFENPSFTIQYNNYQNNFCGTEQKNQNLREIIYNEIIKMEAQKANKNQTNGTQNLGNNTYETPTAPLRNVNKQYIQQKIVAQNIQLYPTHNIMSNAMPITTQNINYPMSNITTNDLDAGAGGCGFMNNNNSSKINLDHSFVLSNQGQFESNCLEIYEIII